MSIIFTCPGYWISQGISCGLESGHPVNVLKLLINALVYISTQVSESLRHISEIQRLAFIWDLAFISIWHIDCDKTQFSMAWFIPLVNERGVCRPVKLWDPLRTHAIPERLKGVFMTRHYANPCSPLPLPLPSAFKTQFLLEHRHQNPGRLLEAGI